MIRYASVCSGVEAPTLAWHELGWAPVWFSEIEPFPSEVLKQRFPNTPNLGDMTKLVEKEYFHEQPIDLLVGGTPCQSFSLAGLQRGLDDPRGNLALEFVRLLHVKRPTWFVWENVPGVLSSNGGRDFATILAAFTQVGYHCSWRVLDSQFFGVAQRRRRVFVVGHLGDWRSSAAVLFERQGQEGNTRKSKATWKETPRPSGSGIAAFDQRGFGDCGSGRTSSTLKARDYKDATDLVVYPYAYSKSHRSSGKVDVRFTDDGKANTLSCGDGCGNQSSLNIVVHPIQYGSAAAGKSQGGVGVGQDGEPSYTLTRQDIHGVAVYYDTAQITNPNNRNNPSPEICHALSKDQHPPLLVPSINARQDPVSRLDGVGALDRDGGTHALFVQAGVRRLTPLECERLQGFPDNHTNILWRGKPSPNTLRYKAIGNSMAVPCMAWIGKRIDFVQRFNNAERFL